LRAAGLIGYISDETAIRRKQAVAFVEFRCDQLHRLAISFERKHPEVSFSFGIRNCVIKEEAAGRRETCRTFALPGLQEDLLVLYAACRLLIEVEHTVTIGSKDDTTPIRKPDRTSG